MHTKMIAGVNSLVRGFTILLGTSAPPDKHQISIYAIEYFIIYNVYL